MLVIEMFIMAGIRFKWFSYLQVMSDTRGERRPVLPAANFPACEGLLNSLSKVRLWFWPPSHPQKIVWLMLAAVFLSAVCFNKNLRFKDVYVIFSNAPQFTGLSNRAWTEFLGANKTAQKTIEAIWATRLAATKYQMYSIFRILKNGTVCNKQSGCMQLVFIVFVETLKSF